MDLKSNKHYTTEDEEYFCRSVKCIVTEASGHQFSLIFVKDGNISGYNEGK